MDDHHSEKPCDKVEAHRLADIAKIIAVPNLRPKWVFLLCFVLEPLPTLQQGFVVLQSLSFSNKMLHKLVCSSLHFDQNVPMKECSENTVRRAQWRTGPLGSPQAPRQLKPKFYLHCLFLQYEPFCVLQPCQKQS